LATGIEPAAKIAHSPPAVSGGDLYWRETATRARIPHLSKEPELTISLLTRLGAAVLLAATLLTQAQARDDTRPAQEQVLVAFASDEGLARLARAVAKVDFPVLANQFEAQSNVAFCGPTTAAIVLNAARGRSRDLPRDRSRLRAEDFQYLPRGFDPSVPRFTQDNVISKGQKTRSQVLGEPVIINGKQVRDFGYQLRQLNELLRANGLVTRLTIVDDKKSEEAIRTELVENLKRPDDYVVVNYRRDEVGQRGGGHISPLGAYDAESDSFLVMDVNPAAASWVWMPTATLVRGMRTFDTVENRGYILINSR
jgi:phytochelatin synthase